MHYRRTLQIGTNISRWVLVSQKHFTVKASCVQYKNQLYLKMCFITWENVYVLSTVLLFYSQVYTLCAAMWLSSFLSVNFLVFLLT